MADEKAKCQRCLKAGHWTADCKSTPVYKSRPTRTALLKNPALKLPETLQEKVPVAEILPQPEVYKSSSESELSYHSSDFDESDPGELESEVGLELETKAEDESKAGDNTKLSESDFSSSQSEGEIEPAEKRIKRQ